MQVNPPVYTFLREAPTKTSEELVFWVITQPHIYPYM